VTGRGLFWLARANLRADRRGAIVNAAAICIGAAALVFFVALGLGVGVAARRMFPADARLVEVVPAAVSLGGLFGGGELDDAALARLRALPGVASAHPRLLARVPITAPRAPPGLSQQWPSGMTLQIPVVGIDPALLADDVAAGFRFEDPGPGAPIPVMLSRRLLEVYDKTIAPSWGVRRLPPGVSLVGLEMPVRIGHSILPGRSEGRVEQRTIRLAGLSDRVPLYLLAMPLEVVRRLHAAYGKEDGGLSSVTLVAKRPDDVPALSAAVRRMGFAVDESERAAAERVGTVVAITTGALALLAILMSALAALAIGQSLSASVRGRLREIAIVEALGATPADVRRVVLLEAAMLGLAGGVLGVFLARLAAVGVDRAGLGALPDFPFRPETLFAFPWWLPLAGVGVATLAAVVGALAPAAMAARVDPARAIA
jgi:putative ABC transport system permease protein